MKFRTPLLAAALVALPVLAACGGDDSSGSTTVAVPTDNTPVGTDSPGSTDTPTGTGFEHATGPDDVVIRIGYTGGFVPPGAAFSETPNLLLTGDGAVYTPGMTTLEYPGPLRLPVERRTLDEAGIQALLALADEHGLLAEPPEYPRNDQIADAADTYVDITVGGETYHHQAYALGLDGGAASETDPARKALAEFVDAATNVSAAVPEGSLADGELVTGDLEVMATVVEPANYDDPAITPWTSDSGVTLADAAQCAVVPASDAAASALLADATQATLFTEGDATYQLAVRPQLPGGPAC
jgi:hypothetical protein